MESVSTVTGGFFYISKFWGVLYSKRKLGKVQDLTSCPLPQKVLASPYHWTLDMSLIQWSVECSQGFISLTHTCYFYLPGLICVMASTQCSNMLMAQQRQLKDH